ncbi:DegT/DnrJ/EryC1/StrS family aminotransferase [Tetragenococcus halophilus]|uniref:DegT/DnrJ/EryC1/StrS family aminotransferase n=1 Tax=Tetragenococcus halophilus TaxID=51669 RepID=UPI0030E7E6B4
MSEKILLSSPHMSEEGYEQEFVKEAFDTNWVAPLGKNVTEFENEVSDYVGIRHAAALSSGTAAIHMALKAAGVKQGDVVFCQSLTFSATANPIIYQDAIPVFIDSNKETWNMDPNALEEAFTKYPEVKAVIVVHLYGLSAELEEIVDICKKHNVTLIEDAAESLGTKYKGKYTGTFGDFGVYSFNGNKIITTSGGGMLVSNNKDKIDKVKFWATQSRENARHYEHKEVGYNYRMSNISAGIGRGQLRVLEDRVNKKNYIFNFYKDKLQDIDGIEFMPINDWDSTNCWLSCLILKNEDSPLGLIKSLEQANIESRPIWKPMHLQPVFSKYDFVGTGISETIFETGLCLPSDTKLTDKELNKICDVIKAELA